MEEIIIKWFFIWLAGCLVLVVLFQQGFMFGTL